MSCKKINLKGIKWCKKWLKIHANSLSDALVPSRKKFACGAGPPAALRGFCIYAQSAQSMPDFCQKAFSKAWVSRTVFTWSQGALLGGLGCVWCRAWRVLWGETCGQCQPLAGFRAESKTVLGKHKRHEWKHLRGFTVCGLFNQTN